MRETDMSIEIPMRREDIAALLDGLSIPEPNSGCRLWLGSVSKGYGYVSLNGKMRIASRVSYETYIGPLGGNDACHHCDNTYCIEPTHLFAGDALANMADRESKGRTWKKLTNEQVRLIRDSAEKGFILADRYGVSQSLISIIRNRKWRSHQ